MKLRQFVPTFEFIRLAVGGGTRLSICMLHIKVRHSVRSFLELSLSLLFANLLDHKVPPPQLELVYL